MPHVQLKPIKEQTLVITGATSGIGLATARLAARRGASLMLAARNEQTLARIADEINQETAGEAAYTVTDVGREEDIQRLADAVRDRFGGFDTWINNAAVSIYGSLMQIPIHEHRRLFETNYWGCVYGSRAAVEHFASHENGCGGALINLGSVLSDRAIPDQGPYCASKHAIKSFTDSLRMELEQRGLPISVTLIKPSAIDTPYKDHAKNYFNVKPKNPPPVYAPRIVASAILHAAQHPRRDIYIGAGGRAVSTVGTYLPRMTDLVMERIMSNLQKTNEPVSPEARDHHALFEPMEDGEERGQYPHYVAKTSLYTQATLHPLLTTATLLTAVGLLGAAAWQSLTTTPRTAHTNHQPRTHAARQLARSD